MENLMKKKIAIIGGTGKEGKGLAYRWAKAGFTVIIGSRTIEKAEKAVIELMEEKSLHGVDLRFAENHEAASIADVVVITIPFAYHVETLESLKPQLAGKILIDVTVPLVPPKVSMVQMPAEGSAGLQAQAILGSDTVVVTAFQNVSFENLLSDDEPECDILVCGKTKEAREVVLGLIQAAGLVGWDAGYLENSVVVEGLTSILIGLNKKHGVKSSGIRITGITRE